MGMNSKFASAFRAKYGQLSTMRSFLQSGTPFVAMTATASAKMEGQILRNLNMKGTFIFRASPDRSNIKYHIAETRTKNIEEVFGWLIDDLKELGTKCDKYLIYCRSHRHVNELFTAFRHNLRDKGYAQIKDGTRQITDYTSRLFAMFHGSIDRDVKDFLTKAFPSVESTVRVVFATIAFGMGVNTKMLRTVIHYGPANETEDYIQESGRVGRDTASSCDAILIKYPGCTSSKNISNEMREYCKNNEQCRRIILFNNFRDYRTPVELVAHDCCDICASKCQCQKCEAESTRNLICTTVQRIRSLNKAKPETLFDDKAKTVKALSPSQQAELQRALEDLWSCKNALNEHKSYSGADLYCGFPYRAIKEVMSLCTSITSSEFIWENTSILSKDVATEVFQIVSAHHSSMNDTLCVESYVESDYSSGEHSTEGMSDMDTGTHHDSSSDSGQDFVRQRNKYRIILATSSESSSDEETT